MSEGIGAQGFESIAQIRQRLVLRGFRLRQHAFVQGALFGQKFLRRRLARLGGGKRGVERAHLGAQLIQLGLPLTELLTQFVDEPVIGWICPAPPP